MAQQLPFIRCSWPKPEGPVRQHKHWKNFLINLCWLAAKLSGEHDWWLWGVFLPDEEVNLFIFASAYSSCGHIPCGQWRNGGISVSVNRGWGLGNVILRYTHARWVSIYHPPRTGVHCTCSLGTLGQDLCAKSHSDQIHMSNWVSLHTLSLISKTTDDKIIETVC